MSAKSPPSCPRCAYDLSGVVDSWTESCPLEGVCSECGLGFDWHDTIYAERLVVRGFVEHAVGLWRLFGWAWITWLWTLWPPVFWRKVRMEHPPRLRRCVLWLAILIIPFHAIVATVRDTAVWRDYLNWDAFNRAPTGRGVGLPFAGFKSSIENFPWANAISPWCEPFLDVDHGLWWQMGECAPTWSVTPLPSPKRISVTFRLTNWPHFVPTIAAISLAIPAALLVLPATRRAAKVRAGLILRSTVYGCAWIVLPSLSWVLRWFGYACEEFASPSRWSSGRLFAGSGRFIVKGVPTPRWAPAFSTAYQSLYEHPLVWLCVFLVWTVVWWRCAILSMFQGHSPRSVLTAAFVIGGLCALIMLLQMIEFVNWTVDLPGAEFFFPPKPHR